jgi:NADPH2:quinone reductase
VNRATITTPYQTKESSRKPSPPDRGEILVRVEACGLGDVEHAISTGLLSSLSAAGTVIAAGDRVTRFAAGDDVFGHFLPETWAAAQAPLARTTAVGPHVEHRPEGLDPAEAAALAHDGLTAKTIVRAADLRPGQTALVIGATSRTGRVLVPLLAGTGAHVIAGATPDEAGYVRSLGATDTIHYTTTDRVADALAAYPDADLLIDLVGFAEPYFITGTAYHGTIVTALPCADEPGIPRIAITAEPGDLAALARHALAGRRPAETACNTNPHRTVAPARPANREPTRPAPTRPHRLRGAARTINRNLGKIVRARLSNV